jgi:hypothetical protein
MTANFGSKTVLQLSTYSISVSVKHTRQDIHSEWVLKGLKHKQNTVMLYSQFVYISIKISLQHLMAIDFKTLFQISVQILCKT